MCLRFKLDSSHPKLKTLIKRNSVTQHSVRTCLVSIHCLCDLAHKSGCACACHHDHVHCSQAQPHMCLGFKLDSSHPKLKTLIKTGIFTQHSLRTCLVSIQCLRHLAHKSGCAGVSLQDKSEGRGAGQGFGLGLTLYPYKKK